MRRPPDPSRPREPDTDTTTTDPQETRDEPAGEGDDERTPRARFRPTRCTLFAAASAISLLAVAAASLTGCAEAAPDDDLSAETVVPSASEPPFELHSFTERAGSTSDYQVYAPPAGAPPAGSDAHVGLLLQFHGDEGTEFLDPENPELLGGPDGVIAQGTSRGYLVVPILAPDHDGTITWWEDGAANAEFVHELLVSLESTYAIDTSDIWLDGYSGGAQFITQFYLPTHSSDLAGGGAVLFGGGGDPEVDVSSIDPSFAERFPMHWYAGAEDVAPWGGYSGLDEARSGLDWYAAAGYPTSIEVPDDVTHDLSGRFGPVLGQQLDAHPHGD